VNTRSILLLMSNCSQTPVLLYPHAKSYPNYNSTVGHRQSRVTLGALCLEHSVRSFPHLAVQPAQWTTPFTFCVLIKESPQNLQNKVTFMLLDILFSKNRTGRLPTQPPNRFRDELDHITPRKTISAESHPFTTALSHHCTTPIFLHNTEYHSCFSFLVSRLSTAAYLPVSLSTCLLVHRLPFTDYSTPNPQHHQTQSMLELSSARQSAIKNPKSKIPFSRLP
jgi:hypothetical protein